MARYQLNLQTLVRLFLLSLWLTLAQVLVFAGEETPTPAPPPAPASSSPETPAATPATPPVPAAPAAPVVPTAPVNSDVPPFVPVVPVVPVEPPILNKLLGIEPDYPVQADFTLKYRIRWTHGASDQDLYQYLNLVVGDPRSNTVTAYASLRVTEDIDGRSGVTGYYAFDSLADTYTQPTNAQLYAGYVQVNRLGFIDLFRLGRQTLMDLPITLQFDGGHLETWKITSLANLQLGFFGGVPVHLYEDNHTGDGLYGAYLKVEPWAGARLQADWSHIEDQAILTERINDLYGIGLWQRLLHDFQFYARYNRLNERSRDVETRLMYNSADYGFNASASWYALVQKQNALAIDIDPFTQVLLAEFPYWEARLNLAQTLGDFFDIAAGGTLRQLFDPNDISPNNREFRSAYATLSATHWPVDGVEADLTWAAFDASQFEGTTQSVSGDVGYRFRRETSERHFTDIAMIQAGTTYSLYKYDFFLNQEVQRTRSWYAKIWWKPAAWARWEVRYAHESSDFGEYSDLSSSLRLQF